MPITIIKETDRKMLFAGHRIVLLQDDVTRETIRTALFPSGGIAVIQKNGNIGIKGSGIFERPHNLRNQERVAFALYRLKLVSREFWQAACERTKFERRTMDIETVRHKAEELGYSLKKLPKAKKVQP